MSCCCKDTQKPEGNIFAIGIMFALFFMIAFVTNFGGSMAVVAKNQFQVTDSLSQLGSVANFLAYLFMGIPAGLILKSKGYKFTALSAVIVGIAGLGIQIASGYLANYTVYLAGAFVAGFSMCMLNLVVNPLLNTLGGGGNKGNQLVQFGCSINSIGATIAPVLLGYLIGEAAKSTVKDVMPAMWIAVGIFVLAFVILAVSSIPEPHLKNKADAAAEGSLLSDIAATFSFSHFFLGAFAIFFYIGVEVGIPNMANLYMTDPASGVANVGAAVAGTVVGAYWFFMLIGRLIGGVIGGKVSSRAMVSFCALLGLALMTSSILVPVKMVTILGKSIPLSMVLAACGGFSTSVMFGGIFNLATERLGKYVPVASGIFMTMVSGGLLLALQGKLATILGGQLQSYWMTVGLLAYILFYALIGSRVLKRAPEA
ncbi:MAG: MFS transporter [Kiritimatiellia bacterium]